MKHVIRHAVLAGLLSAALFDWAPADGPRMDPKALDLLNRTVQALGGDAFRSWAGYHGEGRIYLIKGDNQSWTKFWYDYRWPGKERMALEEPDGAIVEIYNLEQGKGWAYEYGKVKDKTEEEIRRFRLTEKRSFVNLFRERWKEPGMKVFHLGPESFDSVRPEEGLEFVDAENYAVTVIYAEGKALPERVEYVEKTASGRTEKHADHFFRWFRYQGVMMPLRIEFFTNGVMTRQVDFTLVSFRDPLPDSDFSAPRPGPVKEKKKKKRYDTGLDRDETPLEKPFRTTPIFRD